MTDTTLTDFATIFAHMWYRDFPLQLGFRENAQPFDWMTHIGAAVRSTADLMGLFTHFDSWGRTDAVLRDNKSHVVAALEWEWAAALHRGDLIVNEFRKLQKRCIDPPFKGIRFAGLIGYARETPENENGDFTERNEAVLRSYAEHWQGDLPPLMLVVVQFLRANKEKGRTFKMMTINRIEEGKLTRLREQFAYPWHVKGSRWEHKLASK